MPEEPSIVESKVVVKKKRGISMIWLVPILAAAVGAWIAVNTIRNQGPKITIVFKSADGLEAGKTKIRYNGIDVGTVSEIRLSEDHQTVIITARMSPKTDPFLVKDTQFWVVRPQISGANITGLGTLISGAYIGVSIGESKQGERRFTALDNPPLEIGGIHGRFFTLNTPELGSLDRGTPIYFRRLQAGQVDSYQLNKDGKSLDVKIFIQSPYDAFVSPNARFWQASGIDLSLTASGLKVQTASLLSILIGGIAFETPPGEPVLPPSQENASFPLYSDRTAAYRPPEVNPTLYTLIFQGSVRGLSVGAPVELNGIVLGEVTDISAHFDATTYNFSVPVTIRVDPRRFGVAVQNAADDGKSKILQHKVLENLVARGLRARLETGSLISGSQYISFEFINDAPPVTLDWSQEPAQLPTAPGQIESVADKLAGIVKKLDALPLKEIGQDVHTVLTNVNQTLTSAQTTFTNVDKVLITADKMIAPDSVLDQRISAMLEEAGGAARAMRLLTDYLERHPEALIRGKSSEGK